MGAPLEPARRFQFRIFRHRKAAKQEARGVRTRDRDQRRLASIEDFYVLLQNRASDPKAQWHAEAVDLIDKLKARGMWPEDAELLTRHGVLAAPPDTPMDSSRRFQIRIFCLWTLWITYRAGTEQPRRCRGSPPHPRTEQLHSWSNAELAQACAVSSPSHRSATTGVERIAQKLGITDADHLRLPEGKQSSSVDKEAIVTGSPVRS